MHEAVLRVAKGRTMVPIAHRPAATRDADKILVIDGGRIAESGMHDQLMAHEGLYAEWVKLQSLES